MMQNSVHRVHRTRVLKDPRLNLENSVVYNVRPQFHNDRKKSRSTVNAAWFIVVGLSEVLGTALLLFVGCGGAVPSLGFMPQTHLHVSIVFGIAVMIAVQVFGHISGAHINPAVTLAALIFNLVSLPAAGLYILAQFIGGILGYGALLLMTPTEALYSGPVDLNVTHAFCTTIVNPKISSVQGLLAEFLGTAILIYVCCAVWDRRNSAKQDSVPIKFGLTITAMAAVLGPYSGGSLNPARTFAPAVFTGVWDKQWVYWVGPIAGSLVTAFFYKYVLGRHCNPPEADILEVPLNQINSKVQNMEKLSTEDITNI